ncbi:hypothetical protein PIB30_063413 [Stylosanthes scabra]|uniref:Uncharacterized protein n=1 Tax=Stylosanthes scabra TaxID=79078 RepID=A0ABU6SML6_9FABA|nr:hypothetical protein [Stylosanthes scabra]
MTELHAKLEDVVANSDGSNSIPTSGQIGGFLSSAPVAPVVPVIPPCVASPSFAADLHHEDDDDDDDDDDDECDLGNNCTFGELVTVLANSSRNVPRRGQISNPEGVKEALCEDEEDEEPEFIGGDSDDDHLSIPPERGGPSSSESHQYPTHFSTLDLEAMTPSQEENDADAGFGGRGSVDVLMPNQFEIGEGIRSCEVPRKVQEFWEWMRMVNSRCSVNKARVLRSEKVQWCTHVPGNRGLKRPPSA